MYQTPPSSAGATSWGRDPAGSENACKEVSEGDSVGKAFCDVGTGVEILVSLAVEGGVADGGETGAVGMTDALHPVNIRTIEIPMNDEDNPLLISGQVGHRVRKSRWRVTRPLVAISQDGILSPAPGLPINSIHPIP